MNDNDKKLKVDYDAENCTVPVSEKKKIQRSAQFRHNPCPSNVTECLQFGNKTHEKTYLHISREMTKRLSGIPTKKVPQIHEIGRKVHADKRYAQHLENAASKTVRNLKNRTKHERKHSKALVSDEKLSASVSSKQQSALKTKPDTVINNSNGNIGKITPHKTSKKKSLPKITEVPGKAILSSNQRATRREYREKNCYGKREGSSGTTSKELDKIDGKQGNHWAKKYSEKVNVKEKVKLYSKESNNNAANLEKTEETKKIQSQKIVETKKTVCRGTVHNCNDINSNIEENGAARTRIFKRKKSSEFHKNLTNRKDSIHGREDKCSENEFGSKNPLPTEKQNRYEQEKKTRDSIEHDCEQDSIDSSCNNKEDKILRETSFYNGDLAIPKSSTDCNRYQEFQKTCVKLVGQTTSDNFSFTTSSKTSSQQMLPGDTKIDLNNAIVGSSSEDTEVYRDENVSRKDEKELSAKSNETLVHDYDKIKKSLTVSKIPTAVAQNELKYHTNLINYGYHSNQQYCKRPHLRYRNHTSDADEKQIIINDDAKYDLMKALIQPAAKIHNFKRTDNINKSIMSGRRSECVLTDRDEGLQDCYINSWSQGNIKKEAPCESSSVQKSQDITNNLDSFETLNPHTNAIHVNEPLSNTSDCIAANLNMKGCKPTKKYRHFKHEDKNMCCNMARYIRRMVSNERKYQESDNKGNLDREEVKIIIDENSPKTSKIRIVNDRSSVSVVCHSLGRTSSPSERKIDALANKTESSGGESSGYKSFHNNSNTRNVDSPDRIEVQSRDQREIKHSAIITSHNPRNIQVQHYDPSAYSTCYKTLAQTVCDKPNISGSVNNPINSHGGEVEEDLDSQQNVHDNNHEIQNTKPQYSSYDTKNYLSTFTNRMDIYLPCEIIAYQFEERKKSKILHFNNKELLEKDVDDAELHFGKYLTDKNSDTKDQSSEGSEGEESSEQLESVKNLTTADNEVIVLKEPDNLKYDSLEFFVNDRKLQSDDPQSRTDFTDILAAPAQYRIVTSQMNIEPEEITESSKKDISTSHVKFTMKDKGSVTVVKSSIDNIRIDHSYTTFSPVLRVTSNDTYEKSNTYGTTSSGGYDNKNETSDDSNAVHELWTNKKSTIESTDNDSQSSGKSCSRKCDPKKNGTNKFKLNLFRKLKSSTSEKTVHVRLDQLPKPPPSFLETSALSQSTIHSSTGSEFDVATKPHEFAAPILHTNSLTRPQTDTEPIHYAKRTRADSVSNESINHLRYQTNESFMHEDAEPDLNASVVPLMDKSSLVKYGEPRSAVPPPASALPPPYPFCCPLVPYMMQYWQNDQQPPPASTIPLPEADWKPNVNMLGSEPPPPGVVPIPWFPPMMHMNNPPPSAGMDSRKSNTLHAQPPPEWLMMPRGYAPCLPCSKTPESHLRRKDSSSREDDEPALEFSESKQDERKKKVSHKLFKIFRRKNRADVDTLDEEDKKGRRDQSRIDYRSQTNNVQLLQNEPQRLDDNSIWESPDIAGIVTPEEIGRCFRRGFRADGLTLSGEDYLCTKAPSDTTSGQEDIFNFSDHDTPLDFLLALGFSVDEATAAIRDDEVRSRFKAALTEARIWVPHIATTQGTLLYLLAMKAKPKVMRYFLQLVESIVNKRITNAVKLDAYLKILEKVEEGYVSFVTLFGKDTGKDDEEDTVIVEKQRRRIFYTIFKYAESEAKEVGRPLTTTSVDLLHSLAARYKPVLGPHLQLLACYIGEGLMTKDVQLEAALIYLSRLDSSYVRLADLEKYCGLPPSERRRAEQIAKT